MINYSDENILNEKVKRCLTFDPFRVDADHPYGINTKIDLKQKNHKYEQIPKCYSPKSKINCTINLNVSNDIHIEIQEVNKDLCNKDNNIHDVNDVKKDIDQTIKKDDKMSVDDSNKGSEIDLKTFNYFCSDCCIDVPLRAKHCKTCNKCIATFDHHCSWIANCIGEKNKRLFIIFLTIHSIYIGYAIALVKIKIYVTNSLF